MKKKTIQWNKWLPILCLCLVVLCGHAHAVRLGSIQVSLQNEAGNAPASAVPVHLYQVARLTEGEELVYTDAFQNVGITLHALFHGDRAANAQLLHQYVMERGISGVVQSTGTDGKTRFGNLEEGAYLICGESGQVVSFRPFLVFMPTEIGAENHYEVEANPKTSDNLPPDPEPGGDPDPSPAPGPNPTPDPGTEPTPEPPSEEPLPVPEPTPDKPEPTIPQTGMNMIPVYLLLAAGVIFVILGIVDLTRRGGDSE